MIRVVAFLLLAGALVGASTWVYVRAELPVPSRRRLAALRGATLVILAALLVDPPLPFGGGRGAADRWALLDASASMSAAGGEAWTAALARAKALEEEGWTVIPFGDGVAAPGTAEAHPGALRSELAPALLRAAEAGAGEVRVLSDLRFLDPVGASSVLANLPVSVAFEGFGGPVRNAGVAGFSVDDQGGRGEPVAAEVEIFAEEAGDSVQVEIRREGVLVLSRWVPAPARGRRGRLGLELPAAQGEGRVRYTARVVVPGDGFPGDDEAVAYAMAGSEEGGLVLVTLRADWEPRALLTVLEEATGLAATGYLRTGPDRFVTMGRPAQRGSPVDGARVRAALGGAALVVVHGLDARTDGWGQELARRPGRILLWPADGAGARVAGVSAGAPEEGEWYASPEVPSSPLAGELAGVRLQDLPPLQGLLAADEAPGAAVPLRVQRGAMGVSRPALVLLDAPQGRRVVVLASGFWRWAARDGAPREAYRRLWSAVGGWLLAGDPVAADFRPARWVVAQGDPLGWRTPASGWDTVRLEVADGEGAPVLDTLLAPLPTLSTRPLPSGTYRYRARTGDTVVGEGRFDVERRSEEMLAQPGAPEALAGPAPAEAAGAAAASPPLRHRSWPYLVVLTLLSLEWVARRRAGLR